MRRYSRNLEKASKKTKYKNSVCFLGKCGTCVSLRILNVFLVMSRRRKIPGKKHHGVKDPEQQRQKREEKVRTKVNAAPKGAALRDQQEMPKKMLRMLRLKEDVAARKASRRAERDRETEEDRAKRREDKELLDSTRLMG